MAHIFISYSHADLWIMRAVVAYLKSRDIDIWVDEKLKPGTESWTSEVQKAIEQASCAIVIMTPNSAQSEWVGREIAFFDIQKLKTFPVLADGEESKAIIFRLAASQHIDIRENYIKGLDAMVTSIREYIGISEKKVKIDRDGFRWDRTGSLFWFASDCKKVRDALIKYNGTLEDIRVNLTQVYHHAKRLNVEKSILSEIEKAIEISKNFTEDDWTEVNRKKLENGIRRVFHKVADLAEDMDTEFDSGPKWKISSQD